MLLEFFAVLAGIVAIGIFIAGIIGCVFSDDPMFTRPQRLFGIVVHAALAVLVVWLLLKIWN